MKTILKYSILLTLTALFTFTGQAADLDRLAGKWAVEKTNDDGQKFKQVLELKDAKFNFWMKTLEGDTFIYATGKASAEKVGDLRILKLTDIKAGESEDNIADIYDDRTIVYRMGYRTLTLATNFESYRDEEGCFGCLQKTKLSNQKFNPIFRI
jgi:hypothetical protein